MLPIETFCRDLAEITEIAKISPRYPDSCPEIVNLGKISVTSPRVLSLGGINKILARSRRNLKLSGNISKCRDLSEITKILRVIEFLARQPWSRQGYRDLREIIEITTNLAWTTENEYFHEKYTKEVPDFDNVNITGTSHLEITAGMK